MNFQQHKNYGDWLAELHGKTVDKIFQVDYNGEERHEDIYLPWLFFITFADFHKFLEIEGDFDGDHIRLNLYDNSELANKLQENNLPELPDCWRVYEPEKEEKIDKLRGQTIQFVEYGLEKNQCDNNNTIVNNEQQNIYNFVAFCCENIKLTIYESLGLAVSDESDVQFICEDYIYRYTTKHQ